MKITQNHSLKTLNTFGIDVKATMYAEVNSIEDLPTLLQQFPNEPLLILGGGSNILFTRDFDGLVIKNAIKDIKVIKEDNQSVYLQAGAGVVWHDLVLYAIKYNYGGIENLSLIPGTVGAAPIQNIGAYGVELKDTFHSLDAFEIKSGTVKTFTNEQCEFGYRDSIFKRHEKGKYIITSVTLKLSKNPTFNTSYGAIQDTLKEMKVNELSVKAISDAVCKIRRTKLPDPAVIGNAGSFFKNPEIPVKQFEELKTIFPTIPFYNTTPGKVKIPAGWLNEQAGWKGKVIGETGVHKMQALVLVNYGNAKGSEIKKLSEDIQKSVKEKFGIELETEVNII